MLGTKEIVLSLEEQGLLIDIFDHVEESWASFNNFECGDREEDFDKLKKKLLE